tara:strand:+ start:1555 stop:1869 length:315 start_codon:yes stop_codon:yes gene_type:complete
MKYLEKKMKNKFITFILLLFLVSSCSGFGTKRSDKSDEFLIEKKNPLVMPPDIDDLPKPKEEAKVEVEENNFEESLKSNNLETQNSNQDESTTLQESIIKKIEQ